MKTAPIEDIVKYGLDRIDPSVQVTINLKNLVYIYRTFEELIRFFHNPSHYPSLNDVQEFIGNKEAGMYSLVAHIYYKVLDNVVPKDVQERLSDGEFSNGSFPDYYKKNGSQQMNSLD